ncbi:MAG: EAL domain-containing protein [Lachnospiraceae bacterium]|nr:EAL domain-containing protein [Lachnospiraceae bacterium]
MDVNELWHEYFGSGWEVLTETFDCVGAFLLNLSDKTYRFDKNAGGILGVNTDAVFNDVLEAVNRLGNHLNISTPIRIRYIVDTQDIRAGYLYVEEEHNFSADGMLPVISQAKLLNLMSGSVGQPLLALVQIENINTPSLQNAYIFSAINAIREYLPQNALIAAQSAKRYWIYMANFTDNETSFMNGLREAVENCTLKDELGYVISKHHSMTVTVGIGYRESLPAENMHTARFALYEAADAGIGSVREFKFENYASQKDDYHNIKLFSKLVEDNLFQYHFQPIINAHTGQIVAYETLMRTDKSVGLGPLQLLEIARKYDRLYDIEKATMTNAFRFLKEHQEEMEGRKLYINSIPGHLLSNDDFNRLVDNYGDIMKNSVIEFTEQTEVSGDTLDRIHARLHNCGIQLAIDDYGTGYSNTSNLLRYNPSVVKIDRSLIEGIEGNQKKMNIVGNIIDFLHNNGYLALAEGVETLDEMEIMIGLGSDLIQGFYVGRPKPELAKAINPDIVMEINRINLDNMKAVNKVYTPKEGEVVDVVALATDNYTSIIVDVPSVKFTGLCTSKVPMLINVKDDVETEIEICDVSMSSVSSMEVLHLGPNSKVRLICSGKNLFDRKGVLVSKTSSLEICGDGMLTINSDSKSSYAIGNDSKHSHGDITLNMNGYITLNVNGDTCVGIGAGRNRENKKIRLLKGLIDINCSGGECVGIGTFDGGADVEITGCATRIKLASPNAVGIGSARGTASVSCMYYNVSYNSTGTKQVGIGVLEHGKGSINLNSGKVTATIRGEELACIGTRCGDMDIEVQYSILNFYCEGNNVSGIGDLSGNGDVFLDGDELDFKFITGNGEYIASKNGTITDDNCKKIFHIND